MAITPELKQQLNSKNYYLRLGLESDASLDAIKKAYRKISLMAHPDKNDNNNEYFLQLSEAYETLSDPKLKSKYDTELEPPVTKTPEKSPAAATQTQQSSTVPLDLEKLNSMIETIKNEFSFLQFTHQFDKIEKKQSKKIYIFTTKVSSLEKTVKELLLEIYKQISSVNKIYNIGLQDENFFKLSLDELNKTETIILFDKIMAEYLNINQQINNTFDLIKQHNPKLVPKDKLSNVQFSIVKNLNSLNTIYIHLLSNNNSNLLNGLDKNDPRDLLNKIKLFYIHKPLISDKKYDQGFINTINNIFNNAKIDAELKINQIENLTTSYQKKFIEDNNVYAIYSLIEKNFPQYNPNKFKLSLLENKNINTISFNETYDAVEKLNKFFTEIYSDYKKQLPYKNNNDFCQSCFQEHSVTEKFDGLTRKVQDIERDYIHQLMPPLEDMYWEVFKKNLESPSNNMSEFETFYESIKTKIKSEMLQFIKQNKDCISTNKSMPTQNTELKNIFETYKTMKQQKENLKTHVISSKEKSVIDPNTQKNLARIKEMLEKYISRIEKHKDNQGKNYYGHGFWVLKNSRAINREINYLIALNLLEKLDTENNLDIFDAVQKIKLEVIEKFNFQNNPNYAERGINSAELNEIIRTAKSLKN